MEHPVAQSVTLAALNITYIILLICQDLLDFFLTSELIDFYVLFYTIFL